MLTENIISCPAVLQVAADKLLLLEFRQAYTGAAFPDADCGCDGGHPWKASAILAGVPRQAAEDQFRRRADLVEAQ
jgi:hypothetical protein